VHGNDEWVGGRKPCLGSEAFIENLQAQQEPQSPEIPRVQREPLRPVPYDLVKTDEGLLKAYWECNY
jgi:hypothetical protein